MANAGKENIEDKMERDVMSGHKDCQKAGETSEKPQPKLSANTQAPQLQQQQEVVINGKN